MQNPPVSLRDSSTPLRSAQNDGCRITRQAERLPYNHVWEKRREYGLDYLPAQGQSASVS